jgi:hypothetical protein
MPLDRRQFLTTCIATGITGAALPGALLRGEQAPAGQPPEGKTDALSDSIDIQPIVDAALAAVSAAKLGPGRYARFLGETRANRPGDGDVNPYGCAAAACIQYTTGSFPRDPAERAAAIGTLQANQSPDTGLFSEPSHHAWHATAYVPAALELFDTVPVHPLCALQPLLAPGGIEKLLDSLDWVKSPWGQAHLGAGSFAALFLSGEAPLAWQDRYFAWLWEEQDPSTGLWRKGCQPPGGPAGSAPLFHHLASSFHYLFNHVAARRPIRHPAPMIDSALRVRRENLQVLGAGPGFAELDWVYCLTRPVRQCGHRFDEVQTEVRSFARDYARNLLTHVASRPVPFEDLHTLNGTMSAFAELQQAVPGLLRTGRPLKLILDRRPFI